MSQENVEIVRRAFEYLSSGRGSFEVLASFDPNFVMKPVETGATYGVNAVRNNFEDWQSAWEELEVTVEEIADAGDRVVHTAHYRGRGRGSGRSIEIADPGDFRRRLRADDLTRCQQDGHQ